MLSAVAALRNACPSRRVPYCLKTYTGIEITPFLPVPTKNNSSPILSPLVQVHSCQLREYVLISYVKYANLAANRLSHISKKQRRFCERKQFSADSLFVALGGSSNIELLCVHFGGNNARFFGRIMFLRNGNIAK